MKNKDTQLLEEAYGNVSASSQYQELLKQLQHHVDELANLSHYDIRASVELNHISRVSEEMNDLNRSLREKSWERAGKKA
jgi:hypothetical protein